jgi:hypothetical protein
MRAATVVTDVRYRNEGERIRNMGGEVWLVSRPEYGAANFEERQSLSEVTYDRLILNDGGLDDLAATIRKEMAV